MPIPELQEFRDLMAAKAEAKNGHVMPALGRARLAESQGRDASADWAIVEEYGMSGVEGQKMVAMQALADKVVADHPELFALFGDLANQTPDAEGNTGQDKLVLMISALRAAGQEDAVTAASMFELAKFERQEIGVVTRAALRLGGKVGV